MRILITAGGTLERIDEVRNIKNSSSGRLGQVIADMIPSQVEVDYVHGLDALLPQRKVNLYPIEGVVQLDAVSDNLLNAHAYDAVIFAMAVSDYMVTTLTTFDTLSEKLKETPNVKSLEDFGEDLDRHQKLRSNYDNLAILMKKAPKVIQKVKRIQPQTKLVGFKLLVDVTEDALIKEALKQIDVTQANYVLANDLTCIQGDQHRGLLVNKKGLVKQLNTKQEIAREILERLGVL